MSALFCSHGIEDRPENGGFVSIDEELRARIRRMYFAEHYTVHAITKATGVHYTTVKAAIGEQAAKSRVKRPSRLDPYKDVIEKHLENYQRLTATRLNQILIDQGYRGSISLLRQHLRELRPRIKKPYMRMIVRPGEQAQVDWAHCGTLQVGKAKRKLYLFVMVLSYSRAVYARFCLNLNTATFLRCHELAFEHFGGIPRVILYDNLKSVVLARNGNKIRFNEDILSFSGFYCFEPRPCHPYRGNEKGRVERTIRYLRENYLAARAYSDLSTMNTSLSEWCDRIGNRRSWPDDRSLRVDQVWAKERGFLISLPKGRQDPKEQESLRSSKLPWLNFDLNYYSIPPDYLGRPLFVQASWDRVEIFCDSVLIAAHKRSFDKGLYIDDPKHRDELIKHKHFGRANMFRGAITKEFPETERFIDSLFEQGWDIHTVVRRLHILRHEFGRDIFDSAIKAAVKNNRISLEALRIYGQNLQKEQKLPPPVPLELPDNPKIKNLDVISHPLKNYDKL